MTKAPAKTAPAAAKKAPTGEKQKPAAAIVKRAAALMKHPETATLAEIKSLAARVMDDQRNDREAHKAK